MIYLTESSALFFWLDATGRDNIRTPFRKESFSEKSAPSSETMTASLEPALPAPLCVYVSRHKKRKSTEEISELVIPANLPSESFVRISRSFCVACPELCFLLAARHYSFAELVELGNRLCSTYVIDEECEAQQRNRAAVTSVASIRKYLDAASGMHGVKNARAALQYVHDNCGSPMECRLAAIFFLPMSRGGYGMCRGVCNGAIKLSGTAKEYYRGKSCRGDIVWEKQKVVFEYDSRLTHNNDNQRQFDARRQSVMNNLDYKVVRFTGDTLRNFTVFESAVMMLYKNLKMYPHLQTLKKYRDRRREVFIELFRKRDYR